MVQFFNLNQRRSEKKQAVGIIAVVVIVAIASFAAGYVFGIKRSSNHAVNTDQSHLPSPAQIILDPPSNDQKEITKPEELTFYESLPKGDQTPLGSGINLPREVKEKKSSPAKHDDRSTQIQKPIAPVSKSQLLPETDHKGKYVVQIASFQTEIDAQRLVTRLQKVDLQTFIEQADLGSKGIWHRVLAGPYNDQQSADAVAQRLRQKQRLSALVRRK